MMTSSWRRLLQCSSVSNTIASLTRNNIPKECNIGKLGHVCRTGQKHAFSTLTGGSKGLSHGRCWGSNLLTNPQLLKQRKSITTLTSFNVVDNSKLGQRRRRYKKPYLIGFYRKRKTADIGDVIKVAVQGRPCKALVVATRKPKTQPIPRFDNNNIVLLDDNLAPLGTRIKGPIPAILRKKRDKFSKVIALASRFV